ncbi:lysosomal alpha-glucosidase-like isoform X2 [Stegodyphus dumicola]|uniref:lysosomal alpha-glucosidase-like isoform X2 n=1 Tax=Stegodyphus dumicola TaxID=202533 RepID=UPI0015B1DEDD|nr:lysosomal alpha-glucosidase-like isoform X2 [Stegodyphus dumicola]
MDIRNCCRNRRILYAFIILIIAACAIALIVWLAKGKNKPEPTSTCPKISDVERFDCHPNRPISENECIKRGCCYIPATDQNVSDWDLINSSYLGIPSCFFPENYKGYKISNIVEKDDGFEADLNRNIPSGFPDDINKVHLMIDFIDDYSLRIKIKDKTSQRFEPPVPLSIKGKKTENGTTYNVKLDSDGLLSIERKKNRVLVFKTQLSQLIFSNQFLQLSSYVSSSYLYGLGEHKEGILKSFNWTRLTIFNQGDLPVPHRNLYGSHPFYLLMEPEGDANGVFLLNSNAIDVVLQPAPAVTFRAIGGIFDFFILLGPTPSEVIRQYTGIVGRSFMPPYWSLGFHICKYGYFSLNKTRETLEHNLDEGVPIDVQWHDIDYMKRYLDFTYDPKNFSGLPEFVDKLHEDGRHYVAMISPGVSNSEPPDTYSAYDQGAKLDLFVKDINGKYIEAKVWNVNMTVFPDFSNPATAQYWQDHLKSFHDELKFDGIWLDMNEPLNFKNGTINGCPESLLDDPPYVPGRPYPLRTLTICMTAKHYSTDHYNEHNLVAFREAAATYNALKDIRKKRPFIISRATFAGQEVHSGHWSGDITSNWEDMRYTIPSMLIFNLYGMSMIGSDICGFRLNTTEELCARWHALGAFYPFSRNHNDFDTIEQDPAAMGETVLKTAKDSLRIRYYLLPYLYTLFYQSHIFGDTVIRPLFFEFPDDKKTYAIDDQFLWGSALLILPALYPNVTKIEPYFPRGIWYDFSTGEKYDSKGSTFTLDAAITSINLVVRGGHILPLQEPSETTTAR